MKWLGGMAMAVVTAVMVLFGFAFLAALGNDSDNAVYGPNDGAPSAHISASAE